MRNTKRVYWLLWLSLFVITTARGQNYLDKGDQLYAQQDYAGAALWYEYGCWKSEDMARQYRYIFKKSMALYQEQHPNEALKELERINLFNATPELQADIILQELKLRLETADYSYMVSKGKFYQPLLSHLDSEQISEYYRLMTLGSYFDGNLEEGHVYGMKYFKSKDDPVSAQTISEFENLHHAIKIKQTDPQKVILLSGICPGCISFIKGDQLSGSVSLLAELLSLGLSGLSAYYGLYVTAVGITGSMVVLTRQEALKDFYEKIDIKNGLEIKKNIQPILKYFITSDQTT